MSEINVTGTDDSTYIEGSPNRPPMCSLSKQVFNFIRSEVSPSPSTSISPVRASENTIGINASVLESRSQETKWLDYVAEKKNSLSASDSDDVYIKKTVSDLPTQQLSLPAIEAVPPPPKEKEGPKAGPKAGPKKLLKLPPIGDRNKQQNPGVGHIASLRLYNQKRKSLQMGQEKTPKDTIFKVPDPRVSLPKVEGQTSALKHHIAEMERMSKKRQQDWAALNIIVGRMANRNGFLGQLQGMEGQAVLRDLISEQQPKRAKICAENRREAQKKLDEKLRKTNMMMLKQKQIFQHESGMDLKFGAVMIGEKISSHNYQKDFAKKMAEAARIKKELKIRKRWIRCYSQILCILFIGRNMADRSLALEYECCTYVDIGDNCTTSVDYGAGRSIDLEKFKRPVGIPMSSSARLILTMPPNDRTIVQLEQACRELQKVQTFSEFPISIQERMVRKSFYLEIGPKRVIVRQNQYPQYFYLVMSGEAYVKESDFDEATKKPIAARACGFIKNGMSFGGYALIAHKNRTSSVISRTFMQLLSLNGDDYLDIFVYSVNSQVVPDHIQYIGAMHFMEDFPLQMLLEKQHMCTLHHFKRNAVITHDSRECRNLFIIKYGYCKVFRKLDYQDLGKKDSTLKDTDTESDFVKRQKEKMMMGLVGRSTTMVHTQGRIQRDKESDFVAYFETKTPKGQTVRVPLTTIPKKIDKLSESHLEFPKRKRNFIPLMLIKEGEIFGFDQTSLCPYRKDSKTTILVSLGAEVIALNKDFYCQLCSKEGREIIEKTLIYDDTFVQRKVGQRVNRDVHLEEVLSHYFYRISNVESTALRKIPSQSPSQFPVT